MARFAVGIRRQIDDWQKRGLIDEDLSRSLNRDLDANTSSWSFSSIATMLGVICLCFGAMTFVAANWDDMSRLLRLVILLSATGISYFVASLFDDRRHPYFAQSFVLLGCGCFGATVMLVGQMYHLPGHASGAILLWSIGTLVAAGLTRSVPALALAIGLSTLWSCWLTVDHHSQTGLHLWYLPLWGACVGLTYWLKSRFNAHLCALGLQAWLLFGLADIGGHRDWPILAGTILPLCLVLVSGLLFSKDRGRYLRGFELSAVFHVILFSIVMLLFWYSGSYDYSRFNRDVFQFSNHLTAVLSYGIYLALLLGVAGILIRKGISSTKFDHVMCAVLIAVTGVVLMLSMYHIPFAFEAFALLFTIWTIRMGTRQESVGVTRLGYIGFIGALLLIYVEAAGGLLGTSLFYMVAGVMLVGGAVLAPRISGGKRVKGGSENE